MLKLNCDFPYRKLILLFNFAWLQGQHAALIQKERFLTGDPLIYRTLRILHIKYL